MKKYGMPKRPQAGEVFTDREAPRDTLTTLFGRLYGRKVRGDSENKFPLAHFFGVGGVGKTTLLKQAISEFEDLHRMDTDRDYIHLALLDLHGQTMGDRLPGSELLWLLRNTLQHEQISTPLFDCVYLLLWIDDHPGQPFEVLRPKALDLLDAGVGLVGELVDIGGVLKWTKQLWDKGVQQRQRYQVAEHWSGIHPSQWSQQERRERLGELLWMDIVHVLESKPLLRLALLIDEYERIQPNQPREGDAQSTLVDFLGALFVSDSEAVRERFCVVVMGREKLRWEELYDKDWELLIESHILGGLSADDARTFLLGKVVPWFESRNQRRIAEVIRQHQEDILIITDSGAIAGTTEHLPFHLDLVIEAICAAPEHFSPALLTNDPRHRSKLEDRFLRYLKGHDERLLKTLQVLALGIIFDRLLFEYLITEQSIVGYATHEFPTLVGDDHSYVGKHSTLDGHYLFHREMQDSLVNSMVRTSELKTGAAEVLKKVLDYRVKAARFETPAQCTDAHRQAYLLGFEILKSELGELLNPAELFEIAEKLDGSFDFQTDIVLRKPIQSWLVEFATKKLGENHPYTLTGTSNLAMTLYAQGNLPEAQALQERLLVVAIQALSDQTLPDMLSAANNLALTVHAQGNLPEARELQEGVLAMRRDLLGETHPDTRQAMNNLAMTLYAQGDLSEARALQELVLETSQDLFGDVHPVTLTAMNNLAMTHYAQGDLPEARALQERVLGTSQDLLGETHPDTLRAMNNLALTVHSQGDLQEARALQERVLVASQDLLGDAHPATLTAMNNLATTVCAQGDLQETRALQEQLLAETTDRLGEAHPDTMLAMGALAITLNAQDDQPAARALQERIRAASQELW